MSAKVRDWNQYEKAWAKHLTPEIQKELREVIYPALIEAGLRKVDRGMNKQEILNRLQGLAKRWKEIAETCEGAAGNRWKDECEVAELRGEARGLRACAKDIEGILRDEREGNE